MRLDLLMLMLMELLVLCWIGNVLIYWLIMLVMLIEFLDHQHLPQKQQDIPTAALPDIIFMLLFFFMVTTVMRETDILKFI